MAIIKCPICESNIELALQVFATSQKDKAQSSTDIKKYLDWNNSLNGSIPSYWDCWQAAINNNLTERKIEHD